LQATWHRTGPKGGYIAAFKTPLVAGQTKYEIADLPAGDYTVSVRNRLKPVASQDIRLEVGQTKELRFAAPDKTAR
jgi:hypothetical protein